jgi:uncharacterized protein
MTPVLRTLRQGDAGRAVELVDRDPDPGSVLWHMERGLLLRLAGRFRESNEAFAVALQQQDDLYTRSVSNEVAALGVSDALRPYRAPDHELPFLRFYSALNYFDLGDRDGALVEARALSGLLQERMHPDKEGGPDDWGFGRLFAALVLESGREWNDAWIAYRAARAAYEASGGFPSPEVRALLDAAVARTAVRAGLEPGDPEPARSRLVVITEEGLVPLLEDLHIRVPILQEERGWGENHLGPWSDMVGRRARDVHRHQVVYRRQEIAYLVDLALPMYPERSAPTVTLPRVEVAGCAPAVAAPAEDVENLVRAELDRRFPAIAARAAARAILKALTSRAAAKNAGEVAGKLTNLLGVASERADTRSWATLPRRIGLAVLEVPSGSVSLDVVSTASGRSVPVTVAVPEDGFAFLDFRLWP